MEPERQYSWDRKGHIILWVASAEETLWVLVNASRASVMRPSARSGEVWLQVPSLRTCPLEQRD